MRAGFWIGIVGGLAVAKAAAGATPVYHQDVAPLLARYCLGCHREGGLGRIPLDRYDRAKRYAAEIRLNVGTRTMPPWKGIPGHGRFRQQRVLSVTEVETILRWTDEGTPEGSPPRAQAALRPGVTEWKLGKPDVIFRTPRYGVPATGYPEVRCFRIALELRRSAYVRAVDVRPGQRESVAHVRVFAAPAQGAKSGTSFDCFEQMDGLLERTSVGEWSAGSPVAELPAGMGRLLPSRSHLVVEIRYHRLGRPVEDETEIGLYWAQGVAPRIVRTEAVLNRGFVIPLGAWDFQVTATWTTAKPIRILTVAPHLGRVGTEMRVTITKPGGRPEPLVWVREWDPHWQMAYELEEAMLVPPGTKVEAVALFNNTNDNIHLGGEVLRETRWGWGPRDERLIAFLEYVEEPTPP